jgi:hypothetical protein
MTRYDIWYLLQLGFHQVAVAGKRVKKIGNRQLFTKVETMHREYRNFLNQTGSVTALWEVDAL